MPRTPEAFHEWLAGLRRRSGLSHDQLAEAVGLDPLTGRRQTLRWLKGQTEPGALALLRLLSAVGARIDPPPPGELPGAVNAELAVLRQRIEGLAESVESLRRDLAAIPAAAERAAALRAELDRFQAAERTPPRASSGSAPPTGRASE